MDYLKLARLELPNPRISPTLREIIGRLGAGWLERAPATDFDGIRQPSQHTPTEWSVNELEIELEVGAEIMIGDVIMTVIDVEGDEVSLRIDRPNDARSFPGFDGDPNYGGPNRRPK